MEDLLYSHINFWWCIAVGLLLMAAELAVPATVFLWTGLSLVVVAAVLAAFPEQPLILAVGLWALLSFFSVILARTLAKHRERVPEDIDPSTRPNQYGTTFIGTTTTLKKDSDHGSARIVIGGSHWGVKLPGGDLKAGTKIKITAVDGIYLVGQEEK
jgi:membrane protein implicated in regulation of membrane protease activity